MSQSTFNKYVTLVEAMVYQVAQNAQFAMTQAQSKGSFCAASDIDEGCILFTVNTQHNVASRSISSGRHSMPSSPAPNVYAPLSQSSPRLLCSWSSFNQSCDPSTLGAAPFAAMPLPVDSPWFCLQPESNDPLEEEALGVLHDVWTRHMDARLQQCISEHSWSALASTGEFARFRLSKTKRSRIRAAP